MHSRFAGLIFMIVLTFRSLGKCLPCERTAEDGKKANTSDNISETGNSVLNKFSANNKKNRKNLFDKKYEVPYLTKQTKYKEAKEEDRSKEQVLNLLGINGKNMAFLSTQFVIF